MFRTVSIAVPIESFYFWQNFSDVIFQSIAVYFCVKTYQICFHSVLERVKYVTCGNIYCSFGKKRIRYNCSIFPVWTSVMPFNHTFLLFHNPVSICMFKVNNRNTKPRFEICSKLTIKTPERRQWDRSVSLLLTLNIFHTLFYCFYC